MWLLQLLPALLIALGLFFPRNTRANPVAIPEALANPQSSTCPVPCGTLCCTAIQHCQSQNQQCGEGPGPQVAAVNADFYVFTSVYVNVKTETITQLFTSTGPQPGTTTVAWLPAGATNKPEPTYSFTPVVSGSSTYLSPIPTGTSFGYAGIVGTNSPPQGLTSGQIAGIVGGILGAFFLIALVLFCCCIRRGFDGFFGWMNSWGHQHETVSVHEDHHGAEAGAAAGAGLLGYLLGRKRTERHDNHDSPGGSNGAKKTGIAALLGGAAAGLTSLFASRRRTNLSEKQSMTEHSSSYFTSDITDTTSYTSTDETSESSSSSSSSSSSERPHHHR